METINWEAVSAIAELLGVVLVVASLVFVGWQLLQNTQAIKTSTSQSHVDTFMTIAVKVSEEREFATVFHTGAFNPEDLDDIDRVRFIGFMSAIFRYYEVSYIQYKKGNLDREFWESLEIQLSEVTATRGFEFWWAVREQWHSQDFRNLVNERNKLEQKPINYRGKENESAT